jgi:hypothetical protein
MNVNTIQHFQTKISESCCFTAERVVFCCTYYATMFCRLKSINVHLGQKNLVLDDVNKI